MSQVKEKNQRLAQLWRNHIQQWSESGLSQSAYCRKNNLRPNRFTYWKQKFKTQNLPAEIVELSTAQVTQMFTPPDQIGLKLNVGSDFQIEIPDHFNQATLAGVLQVLGTL